MEKQAAPAEEGRAPDAQIRQVWVGEADRIASFHAVEGYRLETFPCREWFLNYLRWLQEHGFRFQ